MVTLKLANSFLKIWRLKGKNLEDLNGTTPFHLAAQYSHFEICKIFLYNVDNKNPENVDGHFRICKLIIDHVNDKNPADNQGVTTLQIVTNNGHLDACLKIRKTLFYYGRFRMRKTKKELAESVFNS